MSPTCPCLLLCAEGHASTSFQRVYPVSVSVQAMVRVPAWLKPSPGFSLLLAELKSLWLED